jgi:hypothetical protein
MYQPQQPSHTQTESYWLENNSQDDNSLYDKVLARGHSSEDLMNTIQSNAEVKQEDSESIKQKYDALLQHQKELENRIQQLVHIIVHEEQPLPQCDLNFNYDEVASMNNDGARPVKRVKPTASPMDVSPHTPIQLHSMPPQQLHQYRKDAENASQQLIFSQERRQLLQQQAQHPQQTHLQQQQTESMLANFSPQLAVDPFWQMNFLNTNTPTTLNFAGTPNAIPDHDSLSSTPITRKRSNSEPGFGLLQFAQLNSMNSAFNFQTPQNPSNHSLTPPATKTTRKRSNSDAVVFVDEISKARDSMEEKESKADQQKRLVEQQGGYNRDKKKRKYDNMMSFFKFR